MTQPLTFYYDLACSPPTFEIVSALMFAERERLRLGHGELKVVTVPGPMGGFRTDRLWPHSVDERKALLRNVVVPCVRLLPSCSEIAVLDARPESAVVPSIGLASPCYGLRTFAAAYRTGCRPLRSKNSSYDPRLVTITLREADHWPERNSNFHEWLVAGMQMERRGYKVVFVRDTIKAYEPLAFLTNAKAALDLETRADLYASAAVNLGIGNGPMWFALGMDAPVLMFKPVTNHVHRVFGDEHFRSAGIEPGSQLPGAPEHQVLHWEQDTAPVILDAFERFMESVPQRLAS